MLHLRLRVPMHPPFALPLLRVIPRLGLRRFSGHTGTPPPQAWVPTPYVTETIVSSSHVYHPVDFPLTSKGGGFRTRNVPHLKGERVFADCLKDDIFSRLLMVGWTRGSHMSSAEHHVSAGAHRLSERRSR